MIKTTLPAIERPTRLAALLGVALTGICAGPLVGASTNAVNGLVSPEYFVTIMRWQHIDDVWRASIAQGILEGLAFGIVFSLVFTVATGIITGATCTYRFAAKHLLDIVAGIYACWVLGGLAAMGLATLAPEFYRTAFIGVPEVFGDRLRYAWVGGSIVGAQVGGLVCVVVGLIALRVNFRRTAPEARSVHSKDYGSP